VLVPVIYVVVSNIRDSRKGRGGKSTRHAATISEEPSELEPAGV